ncbi:Sec-independent protein translocase protein TatB [Motiliproteus sediminis]|uniref:Sec-independent protein translocase protein TatB n=1 Tax=Motiliproteus sediminis TaxID=1468178 RepID=UPI001AEFB62E|nr:Sec-independent protein translocase protein TatB [Motiliproteus sediminis]
MFDIGFAELLIVAVVALLVLGPERLPHALKTAGMWFGRIKRTLSSVQKEISDELRVEEMRQAAKEQQQKLEREAGSMTRPFSDSLRDEILTPAEPKIESPDVDAAAEQPRAAPEKKDHS